MNVPRAIAARVLRGESRNSREVHLPKGFYAPKDSSSLQESSGVVSEAGRSEDAQKAEALMLWLSKAASHYMGGKVGEHTYVVGGSVRDYLLGKDPKDIDLVIDSVALKGYGSEDLALDLQRDMHSPASIATNKFGVAILTIKGDWILPTLDGSLVNVRGEDLDIATARDETYADGGYKPTDVEPASIEQDVLRREFNFNTLMWRLSDLRDGPDSAPIIDLTGQGLDDLESGILDTPMDPVETFTDDPSRMVRAVKFGARYDWEISERTLQAIHDNAELLKNVPQGKLSDLLIGQILPLGPDAFERLRELKLLDVLKDIYETTPPFRATIDNYLRLEDPVTLIQMKEAGMPFELPWAGLLRSLPRGEEVLREFNEVLPRATNPERSLEVLLSPTKGVGDSKWFPGLAKQLGLSKRQFRDLGEVIREAAAALITLDPDMALDEEGFRLALEEVVFSEFDGS